MAAILGVVTTAILLCDGCVVGPKYNYAQQRDSAIVEGPVVPIQGPENGSCNVIISKIDGLADSFTASGKGLNWPVFEFVKPLYLAPGKHALVLSISEIDETYGNVGHGETGEIAAYTSGSKPTINVEFAANHVYRIGANLEGGAIVIVLWDETGGPKTRSRVATWTVDSNGEYSESALPSHGPK
jgi:hypothetical protein